MLPPERDTRLAGWLDRPLVVGLLLVGVGLLCGCVMLSIGFDVRADPEPTGSALSWFIAFVLLALPMVLTGLAALGYGWRQRREARAQALTQQVLHLAAEQGGSLTAADLAARTPLALEAAQDFLERLAARGICERQESGVARFHFPERPIREWPVLEP